MTKEPYAGPLERVDECCYRIPKAYKPGMRVDGLIFASERLIEQRDRLREAVRDLTQGVNLDEHRVAQEIAVLADRLDVSEEVSRFHSHLAAFRATLASGAGLPKSFRGFRSR